MVRLRLTLVEMDYVELITQQTTNLSLWILAGGGRVFIGSQPPVESSLELILGVESNSTIGERPRSRPKI